MRQRITIAKQEKMPVDLPGLSIELTQQIEERISEFESKHENDVINGGPGWVPMVKASDYIIAACINAVAIIWLIKIYTSV